jgi:phage terminase large subunit GpA-like protein
MQRAQSGALAALRTLGVLGTIGDSRKRVPLGYLRGSKEQRIALLQGLMDTDGHARAADGLCVLTTSAPALAAGYRDLLSGLGVKWTCKETTPTYSHRGEKRTSGRTAFRFEFHATFPVFRLRRKLERQKPAALRSCRRHIVAVEPVESVPVKCITVESVSHLFLVGPQMIPTHNSFPGGVLSFAGANSGTGFRRISRKRVLFDEVDAYPPSAGSDGDQIKLGIKRTDFYWDRKIGAGSTPLVAGKSRIETMFLAGDQRRYYVPCPHCGHRAPLVFRGDGGHVMTWPEGQPREAYFVCQANGCVIEHKDKRDMVSAGEWRASAPFQRIASFHVWAAYSFSPNATWGQLAEEFCDSKSDPQKLRTFVNTVLGETWKEQGDVPDWERLYKRRETYQIGTVPAEVQFLTAGVDVQKDRFVYEVVGWRAGKESWSIDAGVLPADTSNATDWVKLDELLNTAYPKPDGTVLAIRMLAVDSGYNTQMAYAWARQHPRDRVAAIKGSATAKTLLSSPTPVDVTIRGKRIARGYKVWPIGVDLAKSELYGWLRMADPGEGSPFPGGWCHFPELGEDFFKQLTAEHLVTTTDKQGYSQHEWQLQPGRENHYLDCRIYARAAAAMLGLDRMVVPLREAPVAVESVAPVAHPDPIPVASTPPPAAPPQAPVAPSSDSNRNRNRAKGWLGGRGGNWLRRK